MKSLFAKSSAIEDFDEEQSNNDSDDSDDSNDSGQI